MGMGKKTENRTATHPGRPKRRAVMVVLETHDRCAGSPSLPRRSNQETAMMYGGMSRGMTKRPVKNLRKGRSVFPRNMPRGTPTATVKIVTREARAMLFFMRVHWRADIIRSLYAARLKRPSTMTLFTSMERTGSMPMPNSRMTMKRRNKRFANYCSVQFFKKGWISTIFLATAA